MNRLKDKVALIIGAGQAPGQTVGNGRATALRFAQEGASVFAVDSDLARAQATAQAVRDEGGQCVAFGADILDEQAIIAAVAACIEAFGRIDILHNNVGVAAGAGD